MSLRLIAVTAVALFLSSFALANDPKPLESAYWRFEEGAADTPVPVNANAVPDSVNANHMRTFNANTAPTYRSATPSPIVPQTGAGDGLSLSFSSNPATDIYTDSKNINYPIINTSTPQTAFTLEASFLLTVVGDGNYRAIVGKDGKPFANRAISPLELKVRGDSNRLQIETLDTVGAQCSVSSIDAISANQWYHAAVVNTGSTISLYLDSGDGNGYVLQGSTATNGALVSNDSAWTIGRGQFNGNNADWFDGLIDEVRLTHFDLDPTEFLYHAPSGAWNADADGAWSESAKWRNRRPDGTGHTARFLGSAASADRTITLDSNVTLGTLLFDSPDHAYTLAGNAGSLSIDAPDGTPTSVSVAAGSHAITTPLSFHKDTTLSVAAGASLTATHLTPAPSIHLTLDGGGTLVLNPFDLASLHVASGTVKLAPGSSPAARLTTFSTDGGGKLDLTDGRLIVDYADFDPSLIDDVRNQIAFGSLVSSTAQNDPNQLTTLGYAEAADLSPAGRAAIAGGTPIDGAAVLVKFTCFGDANLNGKIDPDDYALLDKGFGTQPFNPHWTDGDFNYDGFVDESDYYLIDRSLALTAGLPLAPDLLALRESQFGADYVARLLTSVPEPSATMIALVAVTGFALACRRHHRRPVAA